MQLQESARDGKSIAIVGGGIAGLCAGIYAQMNGYRSRIYEMHNLPGGLMTAWQRKGYTIDYCIHWLVGSSPSSSFNKLWREVGLLRDTTIVNLEIYGEYVAADGRTVTFWRDLDRLEAELCRVSPPDAELIKRLLADARAVSRVQLPADMPPRELRRAWDGLTTLPRMAPMMLPIRRWGKLSGRDLLDRFQDPLLRDAMASIWPPEMPAVALLFLLGWLQAGDAGYPIGGSLPMARNLERRYTELGGEIRYGARVAEITTHRTGGTDRASGVVLDDGTREVAEVVISAADGHATLYELLGGRYLDDVWRGYYERDRLKPFPPILFVGVGVARSFADEPQRISGVHLELGEPVGAGTVHASRLDARIMNFDPTMAPEGKTVITAIVPADGPYWFRLYEGERESYEAEKARIGDAVVRALGARYPGLADDVEMIDVATPATTVKYTGNWRGSFEGWLPARGTMMNGLPRCLHGLDDFYMAGQWVQPGGGLPSGVGTARDVLQLICKRDGVPFGTAII